MADSSDEIIEPVDFPNGPFAAFSDAIRTFAQINGPMPAKEIGASMAAITKIYAKANNGHSPMIGGLGDILIRRTEEEIKTRSLYHYIDAFQKKIETMDAGSDDVFSSRSPQIIIDDLSDFYNHVKGMNLTEDQANFFYDEVFDIAHKQLRKSGASATDICDLLGMPVEPKESEDNMQQVKPKAPNGP